jgi:hypothetical protein
MLSDADRTYYEGRARAERAIAATCSDLVIAATHLALAERYERLLTDGRVPRPLDGSGKWPALDVVQLGDC